MRKLVLWSSLVVFAGVAVQAQQTSGSITGRVTDATGAALSGVAVELKGAGQYSTVTDDRGEYHFRLIAPGDGYVLTATRDEFATVVIRDVHIFLGREGTANVQMQPATSAEMTVVPAAPLIDVRSTSSGINVTAREFDSLPTTRAFQSLTAMAPGVSFDLAEQNALWARSPSVGASGPPENNYIIEGLSTTHTFSGSSGTSLTMNFVEEVQVLTGGYSAEFGRATGGVFNVVTKSGTNDLHGDVFAYYQNDAWSANNIKRRYRDTSTRANGIDSADAGLSAGGPIRRDRLWYFAAWDPTRRTTHTREFLDRSGAFVNETHAFRTRSTFFAGKLTWTARPSSQFVATVFGNPTVDEGWLGLARAAEAVATRRKATGGVNSSLRYAQTIGSVFLLEARAGRHAAHENVEPTTDIGRTVPRQYDALQDRNYGGWFYTQREFSFRDAYAIKASRYGSYAELVGGLDVENNRDRTTYRDHNFAFYGLSTLDGIGDADVMVERQYADSGQLRTQNRVAFVQAAIRPLAAVEINAGLRYELQDLTAPKGIFVSDGLDADGKLMRRKVKHLPLPGTWAPRLGVVFDPRNSGRSKIYAYFGRYVEAIPLAFNLLTSNLPPINETDYYSLFHHEGDSWVNPTGSPLNADWIKFVSTFISTADRATSIDRHVKSQYEDEISFGAESQLGRSWTVGARLVQREIRRVIEDFGIRFDPNLLGHAVEGIVGNPGSPGLGATTYKPRREYRAVELTVEQKRSANWQLRSSFVYARARGNYEGLYMSRPNSFLPNWTQQFDIPAFGNNSTGKLAADRPFEWKLHSARTFGSRLTLSEGLSVAAGAPVSTMGPELRNGYVGPTIHLLPRGSWGRTPTQWTLDLHADYAVPLQPARSVRFIVDVFNATNHHAAVIVDESYIYRGMPDFALWRAPGNLDEYGNPKFNPDLPRSAYFNTPLVYQAPRTMQVGVKLTY